MDDTVALDVLAPRPALPEPTHLRWQPLRLGLVELFHYDSEEFWFRDGHLLLRGNNGTGKSKVLALTLPFLLDAQMRPSRIEPDGDPGKRMAWNLLVNNYPRRNGYAWIEFGRKTEAGEQRYLTLGAGLSAVEGRSDVESWFFLVEGDETGPRIGEQLWLVNKSRVVLTRERLRDAIGAQGQVFDTATAYRRAVDERLFRLGPKRYEALIDTLIQLRQPQLSRKPDESALSNALTEALPPMPAELLADVADALNQLEEDRRQLEEFQQLAAAVERFERRYRVYAGTRTRREARALRQAQTDFDYASRARGEALAQLEHAQAIEAQAKATHNAADVALSGHRSRLDTLQADPTMQDANRLEAAERDSVRRRIELEEVRGLAATSGQHLEREAVLTTRCMEAAAQAEQTLVERRADCAKTGHFAGRAGRLADHPFVALPAAQLCAMRPRDVEATQATLRALVAGRREEIAVLRGRHAALSEAVTRHQYCLRSLGERQDEFDAAAARRTDADEAVRREGERLIEAWISHAEALRELKMASPIDALDAWVTKPDGDNPALAALQTARNEALWRFAATESALDGERAAVHDEQSALEAEHARLAAGEDRTPPIPYARSPDARADWPGAPLWKLIEFRPEVDPVARAGLESALEASGLLDAWLCPDGSMRLDDGHPIAYDSYAVVRPQDQAGRLPTGFASRGRKRRRQCRPSLCGGC